MKTTIKNWLIVILLVTNLATIISFSYQRNRIKEHLNTNYPMRAPMQRSMGGRFIMDQMNLDEHQKRAFIDHQRAFQENAREIAVLLDEKRVEFIQELSQSNPDEDTLEHIAGEIGELHKQLKLKTVHFYDNLKKECKPEQLEHLQSVFMELSSPRREFGPRGRRFGNGPRQQMNNQRNSHRKHRNNY